MADEAVIKTINLIIAPVVMITACGIMVNGIIVRYTWLSDRVRSIHQEQLNLLELNQNKLKGERLQRLNHLLADLLRHHHQVHDALVLVYLVILVFMLDMLVIALAAADDVRWLSQLVVIVFLIGTGTLMGGMVLIAYELRTSHHSVQLEVRQSCQLCKKHHKSLNRNRT